MEIAKIIDVFSKAFSDPWTVTAAVLLLTAGRAFIQNTLSPIFSALGKRVAAWISPMRAHNEKHIDTHEPVSKRSLCETNTVVCS
jgi:hypothetical protein